MAALLFFQIMPREPSMYHVSTVGCGETNLQKGRIAPDPRVLAVAGTHQALEDITPADPVEVDGQEPIPEPGVPTLRRAAPTGVPPAVFANANFIVLAPRYVEENIIIALRVPSSVETALDELQDAREEDDVLRHGHIILPAVQPDNSFAIVLALPEWTADWLGVHTCILVDTRAPDGRLFAWIVQTHITRQHLFDQIGVRDSSGLRLAVNGRVQTSGALRPFAAGDVVTLVPSGVPWPRFADLAEMLLGPRNWQTCPLFTGPIDNAFRVLSDTHDLTVAIDFDALRSSGEFRDFAATILGLDPHRITVCPTRLRIRNLLHCGQRCQAVLALTTRISRIPIPPGRLLPAQHVIFLIVDQSSKM